MEEEDSNRYIYIVAKILFLMPENMLANMLAKKIITSNGETL